MKPLPSILTRVAALAYCASLGTALAEESNLQKPNVLFIAIDDLNDWVGALGGHGGVKTPNLDRLAAQGEIFTKAYCAAPLCGPSRTATLTGVSPANSGIYGNGLTFRISPVLKDALTLPRYMTENGYFSLGAGKVFHLPDSQSWQDYWPSKEQHVEKEIPIAQRAPGSVSWNFNWGALDVKLSEMPDWRTTEWVIDQIKSPPKQPMFLACGIVRPHLPWGLPKQYFDMYPIQEIKRPLTKDDDLNDVPSAGKKFVHNQEHVTITEAGAWEAAIQAYQASITFADECVGRLLDALDASPQGRNTIVVLWSDHGWHLGQKNTWKKNTLWEPAGRCVLMIRAPGVTKPGSRCDSPVSLLDIYPTILELCNLPAKSGLDGLSLVPLLENPAKETGRAVVTTRGYQNHSVRSARWRYTVYSDGSEELYDHDSDPNEWTNLAGKADLKAVKAELSKWLPKTNLRPVNSGDKGGEE